MNHETQKREKLQNLVTAIADVLELALEDVRGRLRVPVAQQPQASVPKPVERGNHGTPEGALWDVRDTASFLRVSTSWVYKQAEKGELPCVRLGASLRFHPEEVRALVGVEVRGQPRARSR